EFDAVVFFDSLHHAIDERAALAGAYRALRRGGMCVALEPGRGHAKKSREIDREFDVTDKDMPPSRICRLGRGGGFPRTGVAPAPQQLGKALYGRSPLPRLLQHLAVEAVLLWQRRRCGIAVLWKD